MKIQFAKFKYITLFLLVIAQSVQAQKFEKKYKESFKVSKDVVIDINTRYTDVVIKTWNKNTVSVEAVIVVEGENIKKEDAQKYFDNWEFEALGNQKKVSIKGNNKHIYSVFADFPDMPDLPDLTELSELSELIVIPELTVMNLDILDSLKVVIPRINAVVFESLKGLNLDSLNFNFDFDFGSDFDFDFEKYKTDKKYMKEWQDKVKAKRDLALKRLKKDSTLRKIQMVELKKNMALVRKEMEKHRKEFELIRVKELANMKNELAKFHKERTIRIKKILDKRKKVKLKKTIYIKVPKGAKFKTNVRYGSLELPS